MEPSLQSLRRRKRATVAAMLLTVHEQGELVEPESWTWAMLDALPHWCLMEAPRRRQLQGIAGAVLMAPVISRWIDRRYLDRVREMIGSTALDAILDGSRATTAPEFVSASATPDSSSGVEALLFDAGATVLLASLHEQFRVASLSVDVGEPLGTLPMEIAEALLHEAGRLMILADENAIDDTARAETETETETVPPEAASTQAQVVAT